MHAELHSSIKVQKQAADVRPNQINKISVELVKAQRTGLPPLSLEQLLKFYDELESIIETAVAEGKHGEDVLSRCVKIQAEIINLSSRIDAKSPQAILAKLRLWKRFRSDLETPGIDIMCDEALIFSVLEDLEAIAKDTPKPPPSCSAALRVVQP